MSHRFRSKKLSRSLVKFLNELNPDVKWKYIVSKVYGPVVISSKFNNEKSFNMYPNVVPLELWPILDLDENGFMYNIKKDNFEKFLVYFTSSTRREDEGKVEIPEDFPTYEEVSEVLSTLASDEGKDYQDLDLTTKGLYALLPSGMDDIVMQKFPERMFDDELIDVTDDVLFISSEGIKVLYDLKTEMFPRYLPEEDDQYEKMLKLLRKTISAKDAVIHRIDSNLEILYLNTTPEARMVSQLDELKDYFRNFGIKVSLKPKRQLIGGYSRNSFILENYAEIYEQLWQKNIAGEAGEEASEALPEEIGHLVGRYLGAAAEGEEED
jgi:hypothetical protein